MQCDNCGYIFFQPSKKCACCSAPYVPAQSAFDVGQENLFTIFEMAAGEGGIPGGLGMAESATGVEDYNFTDDFDTGEAEYGVDENALDLSDAETEGFGVNDAAGDMGVDDFEFDTSGMDGTPSMENAGPDNFELNLSDDPADSETDATETLEAEPSAEADDAVDLDFSSGFDEVEGLGFGDEEPPAEETSEAATEEISLDADLEPEISLEPELETDDEEPSLELSDESEIDIDGEPSLELPDESELDMDDEPSLELSEEPSLELSDEPDLDMDLDMAAGEMDVNEEEPSLELSDDLDLSEEPELMDAPMEETAEVEDEGGLDFDLDGVDLDEPEDVAFEVPEEETGDDEPSMDFEGLELEMETPEESEEDDDLKQ